ncbi:extracellular solute-binding protein [Bacillus sp. USDA818B3_A]|uniref:extracellular solute-binding protein n=1 Tax=Bacillus sp. USDA818B3_A TaxID=2698834 RepID=UPI001370A4C2|nr:extracellular solute-binding protein [Bacillus sp. USDA818B3_A]
MKKAGILAVLLLVVLATLLSGCSDKTESTTSGNTKDGANVLTIFGPQSTDTKLATNVFTKEVEEKFNTKIEWQTTTYDAASASQKRQISLASGDYPDAYMLVPWLDQFTTNDLLKYGKQGVIIPLNDLIKKYAPNIQKTLDTNKTFKAMTVSPDGNIYGIPQLNECYHCTWPQKMWINNDWLKKLNLPMPKTTEDFKNVLEAFKNQDPNGNGKKDEVPLSGAVGIADQNVIPFLMNGFIYDDGKKRLLLNNGKVDFAADRPEWKQGLEYMHSLYKDGLIDPGAFTQNSDAYQKLGDNAGAEILGAGTATHPGEFVSDPKRLFSDNYAALAPLQGPNAAYASYIYPVAPGADFVLTNKATKEDQIAAIKLIDYLFTVDGQLKGQYGKEGLDWRKPKAGDIAIEKSAEPIFATIPAKDGDKPHNTAWGPMAQYGSPISFRNGWIQSTEVNTSEGYERRLQDATHMYDGKQPDDVYPTWSIWMDPSDADEAAMLETNIQNYVSQSLLKFVTGEKNLDKDWDAYVKGFNKLNLKRYLEIMQKAYDKSSK